MTQSHSPYPERAADVAPGAPAAVQEQTGDTAPRPSRVGNVLAMGVGALALGLLIWAKLQLVVGVPRTAVADPAGPAAVGPFEVTTGAATAPQQLP